MVRSFSVRILICLSLTVASIVGGMLILPAIRHRHDGGETAHSHGGHSADVHPNSGHTHSHSHSHGSSHKHRHDTAHCHDSFSHSHTRDEHDGDSSHADHSHGHDHPDHEPSAHIHLTLLGFELTLPDFLSGVPAPLVDEKSTSKRSASTTRDTIQLPVPFSYAQLVNLTLRWVAIVTPGVDPEDYGKEYRVALILSERDPGVDGSAPPVPPPKVS